MKKLLQTNTEHVEAENKLTDLTKKLNEYQKRM